MLFGPLSVEENLILGGYVLEDKHRVQHNIDFVYTLFPRLKERRN
jgi:branched-chain amino acid transport system ATP-binding protein